MHLSRRNQTLSPITVFLRQCSIAAAHQIIESWPSRPRGNCSNSITPPLILWRAVAIVEAAQGGVLASEVMSRELNRKVCKARFMAWRRLREMGYGLSGIGRRTGRDHTSVLYGIRSVDYPFKRRQKAFRFEIHASEQVFAP